MAGPTRSQPPYSSLTPADASVALRSFGRRFVDAGRAAVADLDDEPDQDQIDEFASRPGADGRSAIDHVASAAERLEEIRASMRSALLSDTHTIDAALFDPDRVAPPVHSGHLDAEIDRLDQAATALAHEVDDADDNRWLGQRPTSTGGRATPLDLLRSGVEFTVHHLRAMERVLREVRGRA